MRFSSLKLLGTVGEPINPEAWNWYHDVVGKGNCPIVDTWWQTETGGHLLTPLPGATTTKPGSATNPFFRRAAGDPRSDDRGRADQYRGRRRAVHQRQLARSDAHCLRRSRPVRENLFLGLSKAIISPAMAADAMRMAITGSPAELMMSSTSRATAWAPPRSKARLWHIPKSPKPRWLATPMTSRVRASTAMSR